LLLKEDFLFPFRTTMLPEAPVAAAQWKKVRPQPLYFVPLTFFIQVIGKC
jgi:hypothetical protein